MVKTRSGYSSSGETLLPGLASGRAPKVSKMVGRSEEMIQ